MSDLPYNPMTGEWVADEKASAREERLRWCLEQAAQHTGNQKAIMSRATAFLKWLDANGEASA